MENIWIPKPGEIVMCAGKLYKLVSMDLGGTCKIKQLSATAKFPETKVVDIRDIFKTEK